MTATRDRRSDPAEDAETAWDDRPIIGTSRGLPWWGAVALAFGLAVVGAVVDMLMAGSLGLIYQGTYLVGCVGAVVAVRRRSLFGPMVQPPLVYAVTAIGAIILFGEETNGGTMQRLLAIALDLTKKFPTMAIATAIAVAVGFYRLWKERDPNPPVRAAEKDRKKNTKNRAETPDPRRDRPSRDRVPPASRKPTRDRPDPAPEKAKRGRPDPAPEKGKRGRPPRDRDRDRAADRSADRRDRSAGDRSSRGSRGRDQQPPRRRDAEDRRPRRDDRGAPSRRDRDEGGRGTPRPRRRPPEQHR
ncbi:DUF6542 domain-containing protein [Actinophytocola gossypii]|uniref:DUF6542 domain-containing protein n=1 Tax=Actinophytocola gossypii TaxID=2812003 RepID=A0ABT2JJM6_9PSEU|nr:DUF6542 domain-containing protein [Actinophytocola gossypii]MCT2587454.1 hypothetical protein [Actinophytocola gossypii]